MSLELEILVEFLTGAKQSPEAMPWWMLRAEDVRVVRAWAGETLSPPAQRGLMRALRAALRRYVPPSEEEPATNPLRFSRAHHRRGSARRGLGPREARRLLDVCRDAADVEATRDTALIGLMLLAGLRRQEAVSLSFGDYGEDDGRLTVRSARGQVRSVILRDQCRTDIEAWLAQRGSWSGPLFARVDAAEGVLPTGLVPSAVNRLLARRCHESACATVTPRDLRGGFLWNLQRASRTQDALPCRYYRDEDGRPGWTLASLAA
jgi:integrase